MTSAIVKARIDQDIKDRATAALEAMGLSISDAIRLLLVSVAEEKRLPFDVKMPNKATRTALAELEAGKGRQHESVEALFKDLGM